MNFLNETNEILALHGKTHSDVRSVQFGNLIGIPLEDFPALFDFNYDDGFGMPEIPLDLMVIGDDWWLERREYDGSEWWEYKTAPAICKNIGKVENLRQCNPLEVQVMMIREDIRPRKITRLEKVYSMLSDFDKHHAGEILAGQCPCDYGLPPDKEVDGCPDVTCLECWLTEVEE